MIFLKPIEDIMKAIIKIITSILILSLSITTTWGQFSLNGEIKPKAEYRDGYKTLPSENTNPAGFVGQRTRLYLDYKYAGVKTKVSLQDVRIWGQELQKEHNPSLALHEAWLELLFNDSLSLKAGRQEIQYDNQRFFSINNFNLSGQKHDAVLLKSKSILGDIHFGNAYNQSGYNTFGSDYLINNYKFLSYLWYKVNLGDKTSLSITAIADGYEKPTNPNILYVRGTYSAFFNYNIGNAYITINPAVQNGKTKYGQDISAFYSLIELSASMGSKYKYKIGGEYFSGKDHTITDDNVFRSFDPTYGASHSFNGYMDYFTYPAHTKYAGLINPYLKNSFKTTEKSNLSVDLHLFFLSNNYVYENNVIDKYLGTEIDLTYNYKFNEIAQITAGYSTMFGSESMQIVKGGNKDKWAHWAYLMITVKPKFL